MDDTGRLTVTLPVTLLTAIDAKAAEQGESRDAFIRRLVEQALHGSTAQQTDIERYIAGYRELSQTEDEFGWSAVATVQNVASFQGFRDSAFGHGDSMTRRGAGRQGSGHDLAAYTDREHMSRGHGMATSISSVVILETGDHLTRADFHRRYLARPDIHRAELIDGVVYVAAGTRSEEHAKPHGVLAAWLGLYAYTNPGVEFRDNATVLLLDESEVQPDLLLFRPPPLGRVRRTDDGYLKGPPDLIVEIAASSASYDLHEKKSIYERAGVPEYVVWRTLDGALDWFDLEDGGYVRREPDQHGLIQSTGFPGLRLAVTRLLAGDYPAVLTGRQPDSGSPLRLP